MRSPAPAGTPLAVATNGRLLRVTYSGYLINMGSTQELTIEFAAGLADQPTGGVRLNVIPKEGGNRFSGSFFASGMGGDWMQGSNYTDELKQAGLPAPQALKKIWDVNPSFGGPVLRDRDVRLRRTEPIASALVVWRSRPARSPVVLRLGADQRGRHLRRRLCQPQRGGSGLVRLRAGSERADLQPRDPEEHQRAGDVAGDATQQVQFVL